MFFQNWGIRTESKQDNKQTGHGVGVSQSLTWVVIVAGGPGQEEYQTGQEEYRTVSRAWPGIISNGAPMNAQE